MCVWLTHFAVSRKEYNTVKQIDSNKKIFKNHFSALPIVSHTHLLLTNTQPKTRTHTARAELNEGWPPDSKLASMLRAKK